ncbi:MAG: transposase, partial [Puniceicoccales bacterium]
MLTWSGCMGMLFGMIRRKVIGKTSYYHVMSRTVNGEALFGDREKEVFRKMIWKVADFSGIRVITYAVMKNHFHILVEVPQEGTFVTDAELVRRYRLLYPKPTPWQPMRAEVLERRLQENLLEGKELREWLLNRMHDISEFMRTLKLRFSRWFNRSRDRFGPVWSDRF